MTLSRAIAAFMTASMIGTLTQVLKGKLSAVYLGPDGLAIYNQLSLFFTFLITVCVLGIPNGISRQIAIATANEDETAAAAAFSSNVMVIGAFALAVSIGATIFSHQISAFLFADAGDRAGLVTLIALGAPLGVMGLVYRALMNGTRNVKALFRVRVTADIASVIAFAALIYTMGLNGAVLGFLALHLMYLVLIVAAVRRWHSPIANVRIKLFRRSDVVGNLGYGLHGLFVAIVGTFTTILISRWIIEDLGLEQSGLFNVSYKVASVYLGGLYAAATGYYYASIAGAKTHDEMRSQIDTAIQTYMVFVPPLVAALIAGGELLMVVFFSSAFVAAAMVLLVMLPGDLLRLPAELIGQALVAKKRLAISAAVYGVWAAVYLGLAAFAMKTYGIIGVAVAYFCSQALIFLVMLAVGRVLLGYLPRRQTVQFVLRGFVLAAGAAILAYEVEQLSARIVLTGILILSWFALSLLDKKFRDQARNVAIYIKTRLAKKAMG